MYQSKITEHAKMRLHQRLRVTKECQIAEILNKFEGHCISQYTTEDGMITKKIKWNGIFAEGVFSRDTLITVWALPSKERRPSKASYRNKHANNKSRWSRSHRQ